MLSGTDKIYGDADLRGWRARRMSLGILVSKWILGLISKSTQQKSQMPTLNSSIATILTPYTHSSCQLVPGINPNRQARCLPTASPTYDFHSIASWILTDVKPLTATKKPVRLAPTHNNSLLETDNLHRYNTRSNKVRVIKTPGGELRYLHIKKKGTAPKCGDCGIKLPGVRLS